jgi:type III restriction enzyme
MLSHLRSYLKNEEDVQNVLLNHKDSLVKCIHAQMQGHFDPPEQRFSEVVAKDFTFLKSARYAIANGQDPLPFDLPLEEKSVIKNLLFTGFRKSFYPTVKFDSDTERLFSCILEQDPSVMKWVKPPRGTLQIFYHRDAAYEPDFVVETNKMCLLCEVKRSSDLQDEVVLQKARAATHWSKLASKHAEQHDGKPWLYLLIPHDYVDLSASIDALVTRFTWKT